MTNFILISNVYIILLYGFYILALRKTTFFQLNRFYLISSILIANIFAFIAISDPIGVNMIPQALYGWSETIPLEPIIWSGNGSEIQNTYPLNSNSLDSGIINIQKYITTLYLLGVCIALGLFIVRIRKTLNSFRWPSKQQMAQSFLHFLYVNPQIDGYDSILKHEKVHVQQKHSCDLLFMELMLILNWFNPFLYKMRKELKLQHEYIADNIAAGDDKVNYAELLLANVFNVNEHVLSNKFHNPPLLKSRIMMLFKKKSPKKSLVKLFTIIPLFLCLLAVSAFVMSCTNNKTEETVNNENNSTEVVATPIQAEVDNHVETPERETPPAPFIHAENVEIKPIPSNDKYTSVKGFREWIGQNFTIPQEAVAAKVKDTVEALFIIDEKGKVSHVSITKDPGYGIGEAFKNLIENSPDWLPGIQNGVPVRVGMKIPMEVTIP